METGFATELVEDMPLWAKEESCNWNMTNYKDIEIYVDVRHQGSLEIIRRFIDLIDSVPQRLLNNLECIMVPYAYLENNEALRAAVAEAIVSRKEIHFFGKNHSETNFQDLSYVAFCHELGHLQNLETGGVPKEIGELTWDEANCQDQAFQLEHRQEHAQQKPFVEKVQLSAMRDYGRRFLFAEGPVTSYAMSADNEDWTESLSLYLHSQKHRSLWQDVDFTLCFEDFWPNKAKLIKNYLRHE